MYVFTSQCLIERAQNILEMIHNCNNRIVNANVLLVTYDKGSWLDNVRLFYSRSEIEAKINKLERIKMRLVKAYVKEVAKALEEGEKQLLLYNPIIPTL